MAVSFILEAYADCTGCTCSTRAAGFAADLEVREWCFAVLVRRCAASLCWLCAQGRECYALLCRCFTGAPLCRFCVFMVHNKPYVCCCRQPAALMCDNLGCYAVCPDNLGCYAVCPGVFRYCASSCCCASATFDVPRPGTAMQQGWASCALRSIMCSHVYCRRRCRCCRWLQGVSMPHISVDCPTASLLRSGW